MKKTIYFPIMAVITVILYSCNSDSCVNDSVIDGINRKMDTFEVNISPCIEVDWDSVLITSRIDAPDIDFVVGQSEDDIVFWYMKKNKVVHKNFIAIHYNIIDYQFRFGKYSKNAKLNIKYDNVSQTYMIFEVKY